MSMGTRLVIDTVCSRKGRQRGSYCTICTWQSMRLPFISDWQEINLSKDSNFVRFHRQISSPNFVNFIFKFRKPFSSYEESNECSVLLRSPRHQQYQPFRHRHPNHLLNVLFCLVDSVVWLLCTCSDHTGQSHLKSSNLIRSSQFKRPLISLAQAIETASPKLTSMSVPQSPDHFVCFFLSSFFFSEINTMPWPIITLGPTFPRNWSPAHHLTL